MSRWPYGKAGGRVMRAVFSHLGAPSRSVLLGPRSGVDNAFVSLGGGNVMVITTDPVSVIPKVGIRRSAWMSVNLIASDVATSGVPPSYAAFSLNLPDAMSDRQKADYVAALGDACQEIGVTVISGHTGTYPGAGLTVVGGGVMFGFAKAGHFVDPTKARPGDKLLVTKGAAIEATAALSWAFPGTVRSRVGTRLARKGRLLIDSCSVVKDAMVATKVGLGEGGVTSMHDATEGGVLGALHEMALASSKRFVVEADAIPVLEETRAICTAFGIDPLTSLSEGTLVLTCSGSKAGMTRRRLKAAGLPAEVVGEVGEGSGLWLSGRSGPSRRFRPRVDGYWRAYDQGVREGLR